jgi:hypothetical protein
MQGATSDAVTAIQSIGGKDRHDQRHRRRAPFTGAMA